MLKTLEKNNNKLSQNTLSNARNPRKVGVRELLRWVYQDQAADELYKQEAPGLGPVRSNLLAIQRNGLLETKIDCAGSSFLASGQMNEDAEAIHEAVIALHAEEIGLVIHHAKTDSVPDCMPDVDLIPVGQRDHNGKQAVEYVDGVKSRHPYLSYIEYVNRNDPPEDREPYEPEHVDYMRRVYCLWWDALNRLAGKGLQHMTGYVISGPDVPREPWL